MGVENGAYICAVSDIFHYTWCIKILIMASQDDATTGWCPNMVTPWQSDLLIGRCPQRSIPSQADALTARYPHRSISSQTNALSGRCPHWPIMSQADALTGQCPHRPHMAQMPMPSHVDPLTNWCSHTHRPMPSQAFALTGQCPNKLDALREWYPTRECEQLFGTPCTQKSLRIGNIVEKQTP